MRKAQKEKTINVNTATVQGYHAGGHYHTEAYAFDGFADGQLYYLSSDRKIPCHMENGTSCRDDGKPMQGFGIEFEEECFSVRNEQAFANILDKIIFPLFPSGLWKMQHDGSLGDYWTNSPGIECITQVISKEGIRNLYPSFEAMYQYFEMFEISATKTGNCGMHVNLSVGLFGKTPEKQLENVQKLYYIINRHYDLMARALNRDLDRTTYCGRMEYDLAHVKSLNPNDFPSGHGNSFNGSHFSAGRVEIRLVGGQKNYPCFRNTMETVFQLVSAVNRLSWAQLDDLKAIFDGCNAHVHDRLTRCRTEGYLSDETLSTIRTTGEKVDE